MGCFVTVIPHQHKTHRLKFSGAKRDEALERFYRYLQYASYNTFLHLESLFMEKMIELLVDMDQHEVAYWFERSLTGKEGTWMLCHSGPGNSNNNCSAEVFWRLLKEAILGTGSRSGSGFSLVRFVAALVKYISHSSAESYSKYVECGWCVSFPSHGVVSKAIFDKFQDLPASYLCACEDVNHKSTEFKDFGRLMMGMSDVGNLYDRIKMVLTEQGECRMIGAASKFLMVSKFGMENMKLDMTTERKIKSTLFGERLGMFKKIMEDGADPRKFEVMKPKDFFRAYASFHVVTFHGKGIPSECSCPDFFHDMACEHTVLMSIMSDPKFIIPAVYVGDASFRNRRGRRGNVVEEENAKTKVMNVWDPYICGSRSIIATDGKGSSESVYGWGALCMCGVFANVC